MKPTASTEPATGGFLRTHGDSYKIQTSGIPKFQQTTPREFSDRANYKFYHLEGDMTYDDVSGILEKNLFDDFT